MCAQMAYVSVLGWLCAGAMRNVFVCISHILYHCTYTTTDSKTVTRVSSYSDYRPQPPDENGSVALKGVAVILPRCLRSEA